ncbi:hypothetical protein HOY82DRAFT_479833 [Tuber indicum]|nr:hypothetical protein HOY82DRAFT_479833 [Tuber indicum]
MTSKEAHTSLNAAKKVICGAEGLDMTEIMHGLTTRDAIFSVDNAKRLDELKKQCGYIIKRRNADF